MRSSKLFGRIFILLAVVSLLTSAVAWAGSPGKKHKKDGFFQKIGKKIVHAGDHIANGVMDTGVKLKKSVTGKKNKVWVCGHYDKNGNHVKGHWRYLKHNCPQNPGQGGNPGQGNNPGQGGGTQPPAPPSEPPAPPSEPPAQPPAGPGQGDQGNQGQTGGKKTLGGLMTDLVSLSGDLEQVKMQVLEVKKGRVKAVAGMSTDEDFQSMSLEREHDAKLLYKVISQDLDKGNGKSGIYYAAYLRNLQKLSKGDREDIKDVTGSIKTFVRHNANRTKHNEFKSRLKELDKF